MYFGDASEIDVRDIQVDRRSCGQRCRSAGVDLCQRSLHVFVLAMCATFGAGLGLEAIVRAVGWHGMGDIHLVVSGV